MQWRSWCTVLCFAALVTLVVSQSVKVTNPWSRLRMLTFWTCLQVSWQEEQNALAYKGKQRSEMTRTINSHTNIHVTSDTALLCCWFVCVCLVCACLVCDMCGDAVHVGSTVWLQSSDIALHLNNMWYRASDKTLKKVWILDVWLVCGRCTFPSTSPSFSTFSHSSLLHLLPPLISLESRHSCSHDVFL